MAARRDDVPSRCLPLLEELKHGAILYNEAEGVQPDNRDFKIWYGEAVVRRQIVKITSGDVMSRVPLRLSRRSLDFYYGKVPSFTYSSLREYKPAVYFSFKRFFSSLNSLVRR